MKVGKKKKEGNNSKDIMQERQNNLEYFKRDKRLYYICEESYALKKENLSNKTWFLDIKALLSINIISKMKNSASGTINNRRENKRKLALSKKPNFKYHRGKKYCKKHTNKQKTRRHFSKKRYMKISQR